MDALAAWEMASDVALTVLDAADVILPAAAFIKSGATILFKYIKRIRKKGEAKRQKEVANRSSYPQFPIINPSATSAILSYTAGSTNYTRTQVDALLITYGKYTYRNRGG